jgi:4-hydroxy 2-oxovalerate aldolase
MQFRVGIVGSGNSGTDLLHKLAEHFGVDTRDILVELGARKVVAGQEDVILDVAAGLAAR